MVDDENGQILGLPSMLFGTFTPKLDQKGRLLLPGRFRDELNGGLIMTQGTNHCVYLLPVTEFVKTYKQIQDDFAENSKAVDLLRMFASSANPEKPDSQGRIQIPKALREYASLNRDVAVVGFVSRVEVWDLKTWNKYATEKSDEYADSAFDIAPKL